MSPADIVAAVMPNRKGLVEAIADAARIIGSPSQDPTLGEQLSSALNQLASSWAAHVAETEAPEGLLSDLIATAPRLCPAIEELRHEHPGLREELRLLRLRLIKEKEAPTTSTCSAIGELLDKLIHHDQVGTDLVWDAYNQDIGGGG